MTTGISDELRAEVIDAVRGAGARFALLHGSRVAGTHRPDSDIDVAAWWASEAPPAFEVHVPAGVDLLVLNGAPLELAGRIAMDGTLLFDDDPPARVRWLATTRKIYADELPRLRRSHREFVESVRRGRGAGRAAKPLIGVLPVTEESRRPRARGRRRRS